MNSVFDVFRGALSANKGFDEGVNEDSENKEIGNSEGVEYSEADLERIETVSDIMGEVFTDEVISNWENLSVEERTAYLNEYYAKAGQALGIDVKGVYVDDLYEKYGYGTTGVNCGDGYLGIDIRRVEDPSQLSELLNTVTHEMRHQLQTDAVKNPEAFSDIPQETLDQWNYEFNNYVDPSYDFEGYYNQVIETDARAFAEEVVNDYLSDTGNNTYSMEKYEADIPADVVTDGEQASNDIELMSTSAEFNSDRMETAEETAELLSTKAEVGTAEGLEVDTDLNKTTYTFSSGCARVSTGTQNYCLFAGSGR